jgi:hypothetical protein
MHACTFPLCASWTYDTPMRRRIVTITLLLILGAIVNVAVAWYGAYSFEGRSDTGREIPMDTFSGWLVEIPSHWPTLDVGAGKGQLLTWFSGSAYLEDFDTENNVLHKIEFFYIGQWRTGWPMRSLRLEVWIEFIIEGRPRVLTHRFDGHPPASFWHEGIIIDRGRGTLVLPVQPVLPGFVINTVFFAI